MIRKSVSTIFGLCCALLALANSPTVQADGHEAGEAKLPEIFTLRGELSLSDEAVAQLQAITGVQRLAKMAASDDELKQKMYMEPRGALAQAGVILPDDLEIAVTNDDESGRDTITIKGGEFSNTQSFDADGERKLDGLAVEMLQQAKSGMQKRGNCGSDALCKAVQTCYSQNYPPYWAPNGKCVSSNTPSNCLALNQYNPADYYFIPCNSN